MTTHEKDVLFYQDQLIKTLEDIKHEIEIEWGCSYNGMITKGCCRGIINKYIDKAKAIQSIQNKGV